VVAKYAVLLKSDQLSGGGHIILFYYIKIGPGLHLIPDLTLLPFITNRVISFLYLFGLCHGIHDFSFFFLFS
jgi:hypothetical protein